MIRSIFDLDDSAEEGKKAADKGGIVPESVVPESSNQQSAVEPPEKTDLPVVEPEVKIADAAFPNQVAVDVDKIPEPEVSKELSQVETVVPQQLENVVDAGDNFLEFETEIAKIEDEVRNENEAEIKRQVAPIDQPVTEPAKPKPSQTGIFTAALEKEQSEKHKSPTLEELLVMPEEPLVESELAVENTSFILPNRTEPDSESQGFILPNRTESAPETEPNIIDFKPESKAEIIRKSGLAWTAGIAFFASVVFLLILGWFADLLLGTSPWGAVGGIIVGSIIGFVQLFRLTSQILKNSDQ